MCVEQFILILLQFFKYYVIYLHLYTYVWQSSQKDELLGIVYKSVELIHLQWRMDGWMNLRVLFNNPVIEPVGM